VISIDDESVITVLDAVSSSGKAVSASDKREKDISEWLMNVIGFDPDLKQMEFYAGKFIGVGFHSVECIIAFCTADDVAGFSWMLPFHKRMFRSGVNLIHKRMFHKQRFLSRANLKED
jgi:hypothetical protein